MKETNNKNNITSFRQDISTAFLLFIMILLINYIAQTAFFRIDLTSDKRFTVSAESKEILSSLPDVVFVQIYIDGELNIPFQKFKKNLNELLDVYKIYGKHNFEYEFIDPFENADNSMRQKILADLVKKGLNPFNIQTKTAEGTSSEKIIVPGAIVRYKNAEVAVNLLLNNQSKSGDENLVNSISNIEYALISTIKNISNQNVERIAFIDGHGEYPELEVGDIMKELSKAYQIDRGIINGTPGILNDFKTIIIAGATQGFSEADKFVIDQYIMQGGKVIWLLDFANVNQDSIAKGRSLAFQSDLNLDDMFFKYGIRIEPFIIQDVQCNYLPVNVALAGNAPNFKPLPWLYHPIMSPNNNFAAIRNLNMVACQYATPIDTIAGRTNIKKTPLLVSSDYNRNIALPGFIELKEISENIKPDEFANKNQTVAILLEGEFESVFKNRITTQYFKDKPGKAIDKSGNNKMIVISDADIIRNDVRYTPQGPRISPLGFDKFTNQTFGNKDFIANLVYYLNDEIDLTSLRTKDVKLRLLDKNQMSEHMQKWQIINCVLPPSLVIIFGFLFIFYRRKKICS